MVKKAVYSFWTKPFEDENVGFNSEEAFIQCLYLSLFFSKKHFENVVLVTDTYGKNLLIDKYNLPFDEFSIELDKLNTFNARHWSIGKLKACQIQTEPFIHIDNDVILFKPLDDSILQADASFQSLEGNLFERYYQFCMDDLKHNWLDKPEWIDSDNLLAYNCGIILFNNLSIINEWFDTSLYYINHIDNKIIQGYDYEGNLPCLIFEQVFIKQLLDRENFNVKLLTDLNDNENRQIINDDLASQIGYTHLISSSKREKKIEEKIKNRLIIEDNVFYEKIQILKDI